MEPVKVTATYKIAAEALGVKKIEITVENASPKDVTKILVNDEEVKIQSVDEKVVVILVATNVDKLEVVVGDETITATIAK